MGLMLLRQSACLVTSLAYEQFPRFLAGTLVPVMAFGESPGARAVLGLVSVSRGRSQPSTSRVSILFLLVVS